MASPSGLTWLVSRKRLPCRICDSRSSGAFIPPIVQALQEVGDPLAVLGPAVELEGELGGDPQCAAGGRAACAGSRVAWRRRLDAPPRAASSSPSTETRRAACRRSGVTSTAETVARRRAGRGPRAGAAVDSSARSRSPTRSVRRLIARSSRICGSQRRSGTPRAARRRGGASRPSGGRSRSRSSVTTAIEISARWCRSWKPVSATDTR